MVQKLRKIILSALVLAFLFSCTKETPVPPTGSSEPSSSEAIDLNAIEWPSNTPSHLKEIFYNRVSTALDKTTGSCTQKVTWGFTAGNGLGNGIAGTYDLEIDIDTYERTSIIVQDAGHLGMFCAQTDVPWDMCSAALLFDGIYLTYDKSDPVAWPIQPTTLEHPYWIQGPYNIFPKSVAADFGGNPDIQWEWRDGQDSGTTFRTTDLLHVEYENFTWNGTVREANYRVRWYEDDTILPHDYSCYYIFPLGDLIQVALQMSPNDGWKDVITEGDRWGTLVMGDDVFKYYIIVYFSARVRTTRIAP